MKYYPLLKYYPPSTGRSGGRRPPEAKIQVKILKDVGGEILPPLVRGDSGTRGGNISRNSVDQCLLGAETLVANLPNKF